MTTVAAKSGVEGKPHRFLTFQDQLSRIQISFAKQNDKTNRFNEGNDIVAITLIHV